MKTLIMLQVNDLFGLVAVLFQFFLLLKQIKFYVAAQHTIIVNFLTMHLYVFIAVCDNVLWLNMAWVVLLL